MTRGHVRTGTTVNAGIQNGSDRLRRARFTLSQGAATRPLSRRLL
jgi:hypothetical protein